ncbi:isoamylase early set domain-containing protein [Catenovulum sp. 2E275]|uniref:isoamylase early set domain-containing protein n=1 Tax=Catenovulum sp. 2E275 TaxID=2980497 RepID=UPI0021D3A84A|nr:isoamylase early set domain-containing protein [Catenovulum sp. 2E275]MCU4676717.1 isoamylase early set domain-containing protein [Catenovulum sp. 2E275]
MSLKKQYLKSKPVCKVTFRLTAEQAQQADEVYLVGDFNKWDHVSHPMKKLKNGDFTLNLDLTSGEAYQFKYLLNGETWENDWDADNYLPSPVGGTDNSVVNCSGA